MAKYSAKKLREARVGRVIKFENYYHNPTMGIIIKIDEMDDDEPIKVLDLDCEYAHTQWVNREDVMSIYKRIGIVTKVESDKDIHNVMIYDKRIYIPEYSFIVTFESLEQFFTKTGRLRRKHISDEIGLDYDFNAEIINKRFCIGCNVFEKKDIEEFWKLCRSTIKKDGKNV